MTGIALVTGARSPAALDIARDMDAAGLTVHMADSSRARISRWSSVPAAVHRLSSPVRDPVRFRHDVAALVARLNPVIVVPTCEEVFHLAAARADGVDVGPLFAPDMATLDRLHAKDRFNDLACSLGLDAPATAVLTASVDPGTLDLDRTVLKACYSRFGAQTLVRPTHAQAIAIRPTPARPWIAQALVEGIEHSSYAIAVDGRVTAFAAYRSTLRMGGGAGYAFRPAQDAVHARMLGASRVIAAGLGTSGQIALDAIDDGQRSWLIECNPRATSGAHLLVGDGRIARAMMGHDGIVAGGGGDRYNLPMMLTHGLVNRSQGAGPLAMLRTGRDVIGAPGDRLPVFGAIADTAGYAWAARGARTTLTGATTEDIEWNGARE